MANSPDDYWRAQHMRSHEVFTGENDTTEALANATRWAEIAYDKATATHDLPALSAALTIVASINTTLMWKVLQPPEAE